MVIFQRIDLLVLHILPIVEVMQEVIVEFTGDSVGDAHINRIEGSIKVSYKTEDCCGECLEVFLLVRVDTDVQGS